MKTHRPHCPADQKSGFAETGSAGHKVCQTSQCAQSLRLNAVTTVILFPTTNERHYMLYTCPHCGTQYETVAHWQCPSPACIARRIAEGRRFDELFANTPTTDDDTDE